MKRLTWLPLIAALLAGLFPAMQANADEIRPALLDIKEQSTGLFAVTWKVPMRGDKVLAITPRLPEIGLPQQEIPLALLMFNVGVETGQLMFIVAVLALFAVLKRLPVTLPQGAWRVLPYSIGGIAAYWTIDRVMSFMPFGV